MSIKSAVLAAITGNENLDPNELTAEVPAQELAEAVADVVVAEVETELAEAGADIEKLEAKIEYLEDELEELEEEVDGLESMISGKVDFNAALAHDKFQRAAKIAARLSGTKVSVVGAESFADASTAGVDTVSGMESMKDTLKKGAETAAKFFVELYNGFIAYIKGLFNKFGAIEKKATAMKSTAKEVKEGLIKAPAAASWLKVDGAAPDVSGMLGKVVAACADAVKQTDATKLQAAETALKGLGTSKASGEGFEVAVGAGSFKVSVQDKGASVTKITGGEAKEISGVSKQRAIAILNEVAAEAKKLQSAKLDVSALNAQRDQVIAGLKRLEGDDVAAKVKDAKAIAKSALVLQKGAGDIAGQILQAQLAFVGAHF